MRRARWMSVVVGALIGVAPGSAQAGFSTFSGAGGTNTSGGALTAMNVFSAAIGGANNGNGPAATTGFRAINWDGVPASASDPNPFPADFFNTVNPRGLIANASVGNNIVGVPGSGAFANDGGPNFVAFSPANVFSPNDGGKVINLTFHVPGTDEAATTRGFGAIFLDPDAANTTALQALDGAGNVVQTIFAPVINGGPAFAGMVGTTPSDQIASVRITLGNKAPLTNADGGAASDVVLLDDFAYAEPQDVRTGTLNVASQALTTPEGATAFVTVQRDGSVGPVTFHVATADGSATADSDYTPVTEDVTLPAGVDAATVPVAVTQDNVPEGDETFTVNVSNVGGAASLGSAASTTVTIPAQPVDVTPPTVTLAGVRKRISARKLAKGLPVEVSTDEKTSLAADLRAKARKVTFGSTKAAKRRFTVVLATASAPPGTGVRTLTLKPTRSLARKVRSHTVKLRVIATDAAGNQGTASASVKVKR